MFRHKSLSTLFLSLHYSPLPLPPPPQPANDPTAVTKESLVLALRKCLTATEKFAEVSHTQSLPAETSHPLSSIIFQFCLPLLLDKLTSDLLSAKLDSLSTLATGACVFGASKLHPFLQPFWTTIKREVNILLQIYILFSFLLSLSAQPPPPFLTVLDVSVCR